MGDLIKFPKNRNPYSIKIEPHPDEVIDVDPQILAVMKARLAQVFSKGGVR